MPANTNLTTADFPMGTSVKTVDGPGHVYSVNTTMQWLEVWADGASESHWFPVSQVQVRSFGRESLS
jgi:hypothetical protein